MFDLIERREDDFTRTLIIQINSFLCHMKRDQTTYQETKIMLRAPYYLCHINNMPECCCCICFFAPEHLICIICKADRFTSVCVCAYVCVGVCVYVYVCAYVYMCVCV